MSQKDDLDSLVATLTQTTSSIKDGLTGLGTAIQAVLAKIQGSSTPVDLTSELTAIGSAVTSLGDAGTALQSAVTQLNAAISTPPPAAQ